MAHYECPDYNQVAGDMRGKYTKTQKSGEVNCTGNDTEQSWKTLFLSQE